MHLLQLPPEILLLILRLLGSEFFRGDARRLHVAKSWYDLARPILLRNLEFSAQSLEKFLATDDAPLIQKHTRTIKIRLNGFRDWESVPEDLPRLRRRALADWSFDLHNNVTALAAILQDCTNLGRVEFHARQERRIWNVVRREYLTSASLARLLSVGHLTCLEVDTAGSGFCESNKRFRSHICDDISALLPTLRRLRCRMRRICPKILVPPEDGPFANLEEVIINLSLTELPSERSRRCGNFPTGSVRWMKELELGAQALVKKMETPRVVRILSYGFAGSGIESFDAITQRRMILTPGDAWDADGQEMEKTAMEEESFDP
ncbi:hypothetical protein ACHAPT_010893 [Fusarium lateritium]